MYRLKKSFTSGELSPLMGDRVDFERYKNGCRVLENAMCLTQGPATRRPGTKYIHSLNDLGLDTTDPQVRMVPFIFNENQAYSLIFFMHTDGDPRVVFGTQEGLVVYGDPPITECPPGTPVTPVAGEVVILTLPTLWDIDGFDWAQSADEMYFAQTALQPHVIQRYDSECWVLVAKTFTDQPTDWSDVNGWPERVTFHQQRLAFAANTIRRQTVWMTQAGDFNSFAVNAPLVDSDAVTFTLDSGTQNKIVWMTSAKALNIGTIGNEWTVVGGTQTALTPSNILAQKQTNNGSEPNKPLTVGVTTLFIERHGRTVNEFVYDFSYDSYKTSDLAVLAPHMTEIYSITDWSYQQTPDNIIWCVREDGVMLGLTYQRDHKVVGWHRHITQGEFKAITVIPGDTREDDVWTIVMRVVDGIDSYYVEKLDDMKRPSTAKEGRFLDSYLTYDGVATDTVTGLGHLEGLEVDVLADGIVHPPVTVSAGAITLDNEYEQVVVGLGYTTEIRPLLSDPGLQDGTALGRTQRISNIYIDFYESLGCKYGKDDSEDGESVEELPFRRPFDPVAEQVPLFTGFKKVSFMEGFDDKSEYFIRQEKPLPMVIRAVVDELQVTEK